MQQGSYEPSLPGEHPVGVRTTTLSNPDRGGARFAVEVWYPATASGEDRFETVNFGEGVQPAGRDAEPAGGSFPLLAVSHDYAADRRQLAYLACHLASRGYVVAAPDHEGATGKDVLTLALQAVLAGLEPSPDDVLRRVIWQHPKELSIVVDELEADGIDRSRVAVGGFGLGGWVAMKAATYLVDASAAFLLAPVGGNEEGLAAELGDQPIPGWERLPSLLVAAGRDAIVPAAAVERLFERVPAPKRLATLTEASHMQLAHLGDAAHAWLGKQAARQLVPRVAPLAPAAELPPTERVHQIVQALVLSHLEAVLRESPEAERWLADSAEAASERSTGLQWRSE